MELPPLLDEEERLAWARARLAAGDPVGGYVVDALLRRAWTRTGSTGEPPPPVGPVGPEADAITRALEARVRAVRLPDGRPAVDACAVHGGMVESVTTDGERFVAARERLAAPVRHLKVVGPMGDLASSPALRGLRALDLSEAERPDLQALAANPAAAELRWLDLPPATAGAEQRSVGCLAASPYLLRLGWVGLPSPVDPEPIEAVHGSRPWLRAGPIPWDLVPEPVRTLRRVRFAELRHTAPGPDAPSLRDAVRQTGEPDEPLVVAYLAGCPLLAIAPGRVRDVLDPSARAGSASVRTDGVYAWTEDLAHYVRRWHVRLPEALLAHGRALGWAAPVGLEPRELRSAPTSPRSPR